MQKSVDQYEKKNEERQQEVRELQQEVLTQQMQIRELARQELLPGQLAEAQCVTQTTSATGSWRATTAKTTGPIYQEGGLQALQQPQQAATEQEQQLAVEQDHHYNCIFNCIFVIHTTDHLAAVSEPQRPPY